MQHKQSAFDFRDISDLLTQDETEAVAITRDEFERMESAALRNRSQTVATLSTIASIVAQSATPPFLHIDPHTTGLLAIGHPRETILLDLR
ncbi:MAG: hypothetical protein GJV46_03530 [Geobacter sp.]|nr:hypothetical protein [Geobacter sp.]